MLDFSKISQMKARKRHTCDICGKTIYPGCEYIYEAQRYDGVFQVLKRHIHCDALLDAFMDSDWYDGTEYSVDEVSEWLSDMCCDLFREGKCSEEDYQDKCDRGGCYECELIREKVLKPEIRQAAEQSVRENEE